MTSSPNSSSRNAVPKQSPDVLQWNCRSLNQCAAELNALFEHVGRAAVLLLQETTPGIWGYEGYFQPRILHAHTGKKKCDLQREEQVEAQAAVCVRRDVPHAKLDTAKYCSKIQEVVAVRCKLRGRQTLLVSAYLRPETNCYKKGGAKKANFAWLREQRNIYPKDRLLVGGDFNAHHQSWGYDRNSERGCLLLEEVEAAGIILANDLDYPTRHALHSGQRDNTPDLTWTTPGLVNDWRCGADPMGSDHYPIWIEVEAKATGQKKRMTSAVDCDLFRSCFEASEKNAPFLEKLSSAAPKATRNIEVNEHLPTPDKHPLHLWDTRAMLHQVYIQNGKQQVDLHKTAKARRYAKELDRERWCDHCASFDERTGTRKLWSTFKGMSGKRKKCNTVTNVMLATGCSPPPSSN
ncbi:hypothetical protein HPB49_016521 [Dermacentor silvarum]|uniref:Uncharacterized protein n=1 Tax=Dermacentor silvarum TaxID=543639 RepID=A0ACB8CLZ2_DERSI|nr:hypothetical protein HPB49_016521 [Dermacentor silvarum]